MRLSAVVIAGFFTGGALAVRGGVKAARNSAIGCACLLAIIEGVGIGLNRVMAANNMPQNPQVRSFHPPSYHSVSFFSFFFFGRGRGYANDVIVDSCHRRAQRSERQHWRRNGRGISIYLTYIHTYIIRISLKTRKLRTPLSTRVSSLNLSGFPFLSLSLPPCFLLSLFFFYY